MRDMAMFKPPANAKSYGVLGDGFFQHSSEARRCTQKHSIRECVPITSDLPTNVKLFQNAKRTSNRTNYRKQRINDGREQGPVRVTDKFFLLDDHRSKSVYQVQSSMKLETAEAVVIIHHMGSFDDGFIIDTDNSLFSTLCTNMFNKKASCLSNDDFASSKDFCLGLKSCEEGNCHG